MATAANATTTAAVAALFLLLQPQQQQQRLSAKPNSCHPEGRNLARDRASTD
jgi:hypothetical protein